MHLASSNIVHKIGYVLYCIFLVVPLLEGILWSTGYRPYQYNEFSIRSKPVNSLIGDKRLGFQLNPGSYNVTMNQALTYQVTHADHHYRMGYQSLNVDTTRSKIALFGCSFTYGMGVNDQEVMSYQMDSLLDDYQVRNYGVPGYGTVQGYYQLKELIDNNQKPEVAIFNFADFHLDRNVLSSTYRLRLNIGYKLATENNQLMMSESTFPYVEMHNDSLVFQQDQWQSLYRHWQGRETFALVNLLQTIADDYNDKSLQKRKSTILLFKLIRDMCLQNQIELVVVGLQKDEEVKDFLDEVKMLKIKTLDASLPLDNPMYNNLPIDIHPNKYAHALFARSIVTNLKTNLNQQ